MRNGIEYSKSKKFRIVKHEFDYPIEYANYSVEMLEGDIWVRCPNGPWDYLNNARNDMKRMEELLG